MSCESDMSDIGIGETYTILNISDFQKTQTHTHIACKGTHIWVEEFR